MDRPTYLALAALAVAACGPQEPLPSHMPPSKKAHADASGIQVWDLGPDLAARKKVLVDAAKAQGASDEDVALLLAMAFQETNTLTAKERDASKDGTSSANFSAFNLNKDCLNRLGYNDAACAALNDDAKLPDAVGAVLKGWKEMSVDGFMCFHRGGDTAFRDRCSYGAQSYVDQMRRVQTYLLQHREMWTSGQRVAGYLEHV